MAKKQRLTDRLNLALARASAAIAIGKDNKEHAQECCKEACSAIDEARQIHTNDWSRDCLHWRGKVLTGDFRHWCYEWDGMPVDETTPEWPCGCDLTSRKD